MNMGSVDLVSNDCLWSFHSDIPLLQSVDISWSGSNQFLYVISVHPINASALVTFVDSKSSYCRPATNIYWSSIPSSVEEMSFDSYSQLEEDTTSMDLSPFAYLKSFKCRDRSFVSIRRFIVSGLSQLESIQIGINSFTVIKNSYSERMNGEFHLTNCSSLTELTIGRYSFSDYQIFELNNLPNLKSVSIGSFSSESFNFYYVENVEFINLPSLESLDLGHSCFHHAHSVRFESKIE